MSEIITNKAHYLNRLHEGLGAAGSSAANYQVEGGGYDPATGQPRPDFLRVATEVIDQASLEAAVNAHNSLSLSSDKASILADSADTATITCADPAIAGDSVVDYTVWLNGEMYTEPTGAPVSGGQVQLSLATQASGTYLVEIKRQGAGNYESGYIQIIAQEVS